MVGAEAVLPIGGLPGLWLAGLHRRPFARDDNHFGESSYVWDSSGDGATTKIDLFSNLGQLPQQIGSMSNLDDVRVQCFNPS